MHSKTLTLHHCQGCQTKLQGQLINDFQDISN